MPVRSEPASLFILIAGTTIYREEVIRLSLTESFEEARVAIELDPHQAILKDEILKIIGHKPAMGLSIFKRRGEFVVLISIGRLFKPECVDLGKRILRADTVINKNDSDSFYTLDCLREISQVACFEAGVLFSGVSRVAYPENGIANMAYALKFSY
jgi:hypothetical protein